MLTNAYRYRKTKQLICGMEGENFVAYGRLPSPALLADLCSRDNKLR